MPSIVHDGMTSMDVMDSQRAREEGKDYELRIKNNLVGFIEDTVVKDLNVQTNA